MHSRHLRLDLSLLLVAAAIAAACGSTTITPAPTLQPSANPTASASPTGVASPASSVTPGATPNSSANQATYAQIESQVEELRQLMPKSPVTPTLLDEQGVRDWMTRAIENGVDKTAMAAQSRLFAHLGLLPTGASLEQLELDLNSGQAIGFYDPDTKQLYLLSQSGTIGPEQQLTFSHEFTHALQDQNFGLDKLAIDTVDQGDRDLARTALPEGDATLSMTQWATAHMSVADLLSVSLSAGSGAQNDQLNNAPAILREDLMFPYLDGLDFIQGVYSRGGWAAVDKLYAKPPSSTSQILHPDLYTKGIEPVVVALQVVPAPAGTGWRLSMQDTMGELQLRVWLEGEHPTAAQKKAAAAAASMWAGDRIGLYEGPSGAWAVVLRTQWRSTAGRTAFAAAATQTLDGLSSPSVVCGDAVHADIIIGSDWTVLGAFATCKPGE
ncbi:MAG: hypothetical protein ABSD62_06055 [Candidatus Limnocylindrales bacterium]|jgi:hypothetical protein